MKKISKNSKRLFRKMRTKAKINGMVSKPRISVFRSLKSMFVQFIDDENSKTLLGVNFKKEMKKESFNKIAVEKFGEILGKRATELGIKKAVFDKSGYRFHGKVKTLADGIRKGGVKF